MKKELNYPKILIVDDEKSIQFLLSKLLKQNGYKVVIVDNGYKAIEILSKELPDIILLDIMMPGLDGYKVIEKIKTTNKFNKIPVIMITSKIEPDDIKKGFEKGAFDYIKKPFNEIELLSRLSAAVKLRKYIKKLEDALEEVKVLQSCLPICSNCKKVRDDQGYWTQVEDYLYKHSDITFTHSLCPDCAKKLYPDDSKK